VRALVDAGRVDADGAVLDVSWNFYGGSADILEFVIRREPRLVQECRRVTSMASEACLAVLFARGVVLSPPSP
jgi:hypothetical protein